MSAIKHIEQFAEIERAFGDYFNSCLAPVMRDTQSYLNRKQAEEMADYSTSVAGILGTMASAHNPMMNPYQTLKVTGEWNSKTTEDYLAMCKEKIVSNKEIQTDLAKMADRWRSTVVEEVGRERYDELSEQLGGDLAYAYTDFRINQLMTDRLVKDKMPKSSAEYIIRKAAQNTLLGLATTLNQSPLAAEIEQRGEAAYKPSKLERGTSAVLGAGVDALTFGGAGSWAGFARFVGVDLAFSALTSSNDKTETLSVEDYISEGVFGSDTNIFDDIRKHGKKSSVQPFEFTTWTKGNEIKLPFDFYAGEKKNEERYKNVPMVVAPDYREVYLQELEREKEKVAVKSVSDEKEKQDNITATQSVQQEEDTSNQEKQVELQQKTEQQNRDTNTNENGWNELFSTLGLNGMGDIGKNLGYVFAMLPDILVGLFTGRTKSLDFGDNILPIASIVSGMFVKNPILKMLMIGLGGANLVNKAGHEALGWKRNEGNTLNTNNRPIQYRVYADEPLSSRIVNPILQGGSLIATIDRVPCTIQLPEKVVAAYQAGALPLNTLANAILAKSDQTRQMMEQNFEENEREAIIRSRGIQ